MADIPRDGALRKAAEKLGDWILNHLTPRPAAGAPQPPPGHEGN
jgi:hypothetical protein